MFFVQIKNCPICIYLKNSMVGKAPSNSIKKLCMLGLREEEKPPTQCKLCRRNSQNLCLALFTKNISKITQSSPKTTENGKNNFILLLHKYFGICCWPDQAKQERLIILFNKKIWKLQGGLPDFRTLYQAANKQAWAQLIYWSWAHLGHYLGVHHKLFQLKRINREASFKNCTTQPLMKRLYSLSLYVTEPPRSAV